MQEIDGIPFRDIEEELVVDIENYESRIAYLANLIRQKNGSVHYDHIEEFKETVKDRRQAVLEESKKLSLFEKVLVGLRTGSDIVSRLNHAGVKLGKVNSANMILKGVLAVTDNKNEPEKTMKKENRILKWIKERLSEKSTYAGVASILALVFGVDIDVGTIEPIAVALVSVIVAYQTIMREKGSEKA